MELSHLPVDEFCEVTASDTPAPGGGSISALCGALAASLSTMVAKLTIGRKGYETVEADMQAAIVELERIRQILLHTIDEDAAAFNALSSIGRVTYMRQAAQKRDVVHLLYAPTVQRGIAKLPDAPFFTCHGTELIEDLPSTGCAIQVSVKRAKRPSAVKLAPSGEDLPFKYAKGRVEFTVPAFSCHQMIELDD